MTDIKAGTTPLSRGFLRRGPNAFILATAVSGFAWYFASQQVNNFNSRQSDLIRRVEQGETADNCTTCFIQSKKTSTFTRPIIGNVRRWTSMVLSVRADSWSNAIEENKKDTTYLLPSSFKAKTTKYTTMKIPTNQKLITANCSSTLDGCPKPENIWSSQPSVVIFMDKKSMKIEMKLLQNKDKTDSSEILSNHPPSSRLPTSLPTFAGESKKIERMVASTGNPMIFSSGSISLLSPASSESPTTNKKVKPSTSREPSKSNNYISQRRRPRRFPSPDLQRRSHWGPEDSEQTLWK